MPSFDTVCEPNMVEVKNAVENAAKEIGTRFDFKGTAAAIEVKDKEITLTGDAEFQLQQIMDESFDAVVEYADTHGVNNRIAAYMLALDRVVYAIKLRGIYA